VDYQPRQDGAQDVVQELVDYQPRQDGAQDVVQELADYQLRRGSGIGGLSTDCSSSEPNSRRSFSPTLSATRSRVSTVSLTYSETVS
jgi:hypothetical protein